MHEGCLAAGVLLRAWGLLVARLAAYMGFPEGLCTRVCGLGGGAWGFCCGV